MYVYVGLIDITPLTDPIKNFVKRMGGSCASCLPDKIKKKTTAKWTTRRKSVVKPHESAEGGAGGGFNSKSGSNSPGPGVQAMKIWRQLSKVGSMRF